MLEKTIEKKFREAVKAAGGIAYKFVSPAQRGVPDRIVLLPVGRIGFVELKQPGEKATRLQELQMSRIRKLGFPAFVLNHPDDIGNAIHVIQTFGGPEG